MQETSIGIDLADELAVMRTLVAHLMQPLEIAPWEQLDLRQGFAVKAAYFLLDIDERSNVESFVTHTLKRLLQHLTHNTKQHQVEYQGRVRGRIVWQATLKSRYSKDSNSACYVCREVRHYYDTPENQLLKYLIERINECLKAIPPILRTGTCHLPSNEQGSSFATAARLSQMETVLNTFRQHARLRDITLPKTINHIHLLRTESSDMAEYVRVAHLYQKYRAVIESAKWNEVIEIGKRVLPLPSQVDTEGRQWIKIAAAILRNRYEEFTE
ncbi:MAG: DUF2357 domain-containing protein [Cyanobacteriota bacterium]